MEEKKRRPRPYDPGFKSSLLKAKEARAEKRLLKQPELNQARLQTIEKELKKLYEKEAKIDLQLKKILFWMPGYKELQKMQQSTAVKIMKLRKEASEL